MATKTINNAVVSTGQEFVIRRVVNAPRDRVWRAWTSADELKQWFGPKGFTMPECKLDFWPGGLWRFVMHGPSKIDYMNRSVFVDINDPERIVFDHVSIPRYRGIVTIAEEAGQTRLTFRMIFRTAEECKKVKKYSVQANEEVFDRLEIRLAKMRSEVNS